MKIVLKNDAASGENRETGVSQVRIDNFNKAFSVCPEAKDYIVRY